MTDAERRPIESRTGSIAYLSWEGSTDRTPILFLHPVNTAAAIWVAVAEQLDVRRRAVAVDYRAHGRSAPDGPYGPVDYAEDALAVLDATGVDRAHVVCGSIGGAVAAELAAAAPDRVASITAFGASLRIGWPASEVDAVETELRGIGVRKWFLAHGGGILGPAARPEAAAELAELASCSQHVDRELEVVVAVVRATFGLADSRPAARRLREPPPPARIFVGTHDPTCPLEMGRELASYLNGQVRKISDIGHLPMLEAPGWTAEAISAFLAEIDG